MSIPGMPPGDEAKITREVMRDKELMGFLKNECFPDFSRVKGNGYVYKMSNMTLGRAHTVE
jgi:hypothetical protein